MSNYTFNINYGSQVSGGLYNATYEVDWSVMPDEPYMIHAFYMTRAQTIDGSENASTVSISGLNLNQYTSDAATVHSNGNVMFNVFPQNYLVLAQMLTIEMPPQLSKSRPNRFITVNWLDYDSNSTYTPQGGVWLPYNIRLTFVPLNKLLRELYPKVLPITLSINSINGTVINTNSYMEYEVNWNNMGFGGWKNWRITSSFVSSRLNNQNGIAAVLKTNFFDQSNNLIANSTGSPNQTSDILMTLYDTAYVSRSHLMGEMNVNAPIYINTPPTQNRFYIKIVQLTDQTTLFATATAAAFGYQMSITFTPV